MRSMTAVAIAIAVALVVAVYATTGRLTGFGFGWSDPDDGCELTEKPTADAEVMVDATCHWETVSVERLHDLLHDPAVHDQFFSNLAESTVLEEGDGFVRVHQLQRASGMSDREVVVEFRVEEIHGGYKYHWRKSADQSANTGTTVEVEKSSGYWEIVREGDGVRLRHQIHYLPGGNIPTFMVRMFQGAGIRAVLAELRETAESGTVVVRAN